MRVGLAALALIVSTVAGAQNHRLNLQDAEMQALIATVSEITGRSFIVDPRVEGRVTVISNKSMTPDEIYEVFQSVLRVHGLATVPSGDFVKIVPDVTAHQDMIPMGGNGVGGDALVTQIVEVKHLPANELTQLVRPLVPQGGHVIAHGGSNTLLISDRAGNVERLRRIIDRIDRASEDDVELIALQHANASEIVRMMNLLGDQSGTPGNGGTKIIADERTNSVLLAGDPGSRLRMRTMISHLDTPLEQGSTQVIYLRYAAADSLVPILEQMAQTMDGSTGGDGGVQKTTIQAHPETNSLVISAAPAVFRSLQGVVRQLDIRRKQVVVEAIIAEVSLEITKELGVQWQAAEIDSLNDSGIVGGTNFPNSSGGGRITGIGQGENGLFDLATLGAGLNLGYLSGSISVPVGTDPDGNTIFQEVPQLSALVSALDADVDSNVLSTPSIVTLDHQEAVINVGQEVPFLTGQFTATGTANSAVNPFQTIERKDVGLTLTVTPHINEGDTVIMDLIQQVSSLSPQTGAVDLITNTREITTTVMVPDGEVLVLGGLIDEDIRETVRKVPGLGDVPILGNLFKYRSSTRVKRNLMVFIRPQIIDEDASRDAITGAKYNYMRAEQLRAREDYDGLGEATDLPLLPELESYENSDYLEGKDVPDGSQ
ncbi:MAG: type II secretion system secretin GspD [Pseudomonadota bacterium]